MNQFISVDCKWQLWNCIEFGGQVKVESLANFVDDGGNILVAGGQIWVRIKNVLDKSDLAFWPVILYIFRDYLLRENIYIFTLVLKEKQ